MEEPLPGFIDIEQELQRFPLSVVEEYRKAYGELRPLLPPQELLQWAQLGVSIAQQTVRSWEAASEYFRASPVVLPILSFSRMIPWARWGERLCQSSPSVAQAYFRASHQCASLLPAEHLEDWADLGQSLYKGTWKSSTLASRFFDVSPQLLRHLSLAELERLVGLIDGLTNYSYDLASECLLLSQEVFARLGESKGPFLNLLAAVANSGWRETKGCLETVSKAISKVEESQRGRFLQLAERFAGSNYGSIASFLLESSQALSLLNPSSHDYVLAMGETLITAYPQVLPEFFKSMPLVLHRVTPPQAAAWFAEGIRILRENPDRGMAFFKLESSHTQKVLEGLSSAVELSKLKELLRMYSRALSGFSVEISSSQELAQKGIGWVSAEQPTTEGSTVYLPSVVNRYMEKPANFGWYKVVTTHQVGHLEFDSFHFSYNTPSTLFHDLRPSLAQAASKKRAEEQNGQQPEERRWITDMERFFDLFQDRRLALDIFTVVEDGRLDARIKGEYAGIRNHYRRVQRDTLEDRPPLQSLPLRQAMVEFQVRLSLGQHRALPRPHPYRNEFRKIARIVHRIFKPGSTVEDTAEATLRIYAIIVQVPNEEMDEDQWEAEDFLNENDQQDEGEELEELLAMLQGEAGQGSPTTKENDEEQPYESPKDIEYRGAFKPELAQLLAKLKGMQQRIGQPAVEAVSPEMLEELLSRNVEFESVQGDIASAAGLFANNLMREAGMPPLNLPAAGQGPFVHEDEEAGSLEIREPNTYLYDEWDFRAGDYKPRWCIVRERVMPQGDIVFWRQTLQSHSSLLAQVRRQFEMMAPESFRKIKRLKDGEEFDLDAVIEALIDKRSGITPSEKIYWRRNKVQRDVAVALLLDMSASTAEAIDESRRAADERDAPDDPVEYMLWLRARRGETGRHHYKRIIDLEKESTVLLMQALETLDDKYSIYGFSGYGRENVEFYILKDADERLSESVRRRMDKVTPLHATRMGPAIRHATTKLEKLEARTKVLLLLSDGRPQDRGYSREGVEKEYAVHDTKMALVEARRKNIVPFCLTVDKTGHDYLKTMCQDMGYEVLADIQSLPSRLPLLYRRLTV